MLGKNQKYLFIQGFPWFIFKFAAILDNCVQLSYKSDILFLSLGKNKAKSLLLTIAYCQLYSLRCKVAKSVRA